MNITTIIFGGRSPPLIICGVWCAFISIGNLMSYIAQQVTGIQNRVRYEGVLRASHLNRLATLVTLANHNKDEEALGLVSECIDPDNTNYYTYTSKKKDRDFTNRFNYIVEVLNY